MQKSIFVSVQVLGLLLEGYLVYLCLQRKKGLSASIVLLLMVFTLFSIYLIGLCIRYFREREGGRCLPLSLGF